jgi:hypothetical protein
MTGSIGENSDIDALRGDVVELKGDVGRLIEHLNGRRQEQGSQRNRSIQRTGPRTLRKRLGVGGGFGGGARRSGGIGAGARALDRVRHRLSRRARSLAVIGPTILRPDSEAA